MAEKKLRNRTKNKNDRKTQTRSNKLAVNEQKP